MPSKTDEEPDREDREAIIRILAPNLLEDADGYDIRKWIDEGDPSGLPLDTASVKARTKVLAKYRAMREARCSKPDPPLDVVFKMIEWYAMASQTLNLIGQQLESAIGTKDEEIIEHTAKSIHDQIEATLKFIPITGKKSG